MRERLDSPFPDGSNDDGELRCRELLSTLDSADIELTLGGKRFKSAEALRAGEYQRVLAALRHVPRDLNADELNELGCAEAWEKRWAEARLALTRSRDTAEANSQARDRATKNLEALTGAEGVCG